jgi:hypothetical protein
MEDDKLIEVVTGHAFIFTKLIDVLNQNLTEITIQFIQDVNQNTKIEKDKIETETEIEKDKSDDEDEDEEEVVETECETASESMSEE